MKVHVEQATNLRLSHSELQLYIFGGKVELATWKQELEYPKEFNIQMEQTIKGVTGQGQQGHGPGQVWVRHVVHC